MNKIGADPKKAQAELPIVLVSLGFEKKMLQTGWLNEKSVFSQF